MAQARLDGTVTRIFRSYLAPDLLILRRSGTAASLRAAVAGPLRTHNRPAPGIEPCDHLQPRLPEEWLALFADPLQANSALDRLAHSSYQVVIDGKSYRRRLSPHARLARRWAEPDMRPPRDPGGAD